MKSVSLQEFEKDQNGRPAMFVRALVAFVLACTLAFVPGFAFATQDNVSTSNEQTNEVLSDGANEMSDDKELDDTLNEFYKDFEAKQLEDTEFNKAQYMYSRLISSGSFDPTSSNDSGRDLLVNSFNQDNSQKFSSKAFHEAMTLLLVKTGIPENNIKDAYSGDHVWTLVKLDGEWTHIDAALNAADDGTDLPYLYFGLTDSQIKIVHTDYDAQAQGNPPATSTKNNYYLNSPDIAIKNEQTDTVEQYIKTQIAKGESEFKYPVTSDDASGLETLIYAQHGNSLNGQVINGRPVFVSFEPNANGKGGTYTVRVAKSINNASVTDIYQKPYTGKQAVQNPVVKYNGVTLKEDVDYRISYENATNASTNAVMILTGLGEFVGSEKRIVFTISKTDIASTKVAGNFQSVMKWTGSAIKQDSITLKDAYRTLTQNDYKISYKNNTNPGVATLIVEGQGNYSGRKEIAFTIEKAAEDQNKPSEITTQGMPSAQRVTGKWVKSGSRWWYSYDAKTKAAQKKSYPTNEWVIIGGKYYHFDSKGWMQKNWLQLSGKWYWLGSDGAMKFKWIKTGGKWYYLSPSDGVMQTGKKNIDNKVYFLNSSGAMRTGWSNEGTSKAPLWYYYKSSGEMVKGWVKAGGKWYYLDPSNGLMQTGKKEISNTSYYLDKSSGAMKTGWVLDGSTWYYCKSSGAMTKGWLKLKNTWYYLSPSSCAMQKWWQDIGGKRYFFEESGAMVTGWVGINSVTYYFDNSGALQRDKWIGNYHVDKDGKLDKQR